MLYIIELLKNRIQAFDGFNQCREQQVYRSDHEVGEMGEVIEIYHKGIETGEEIEEIIFIRVCLQTSPHPPLEQGDREIKRNEQDKITQYERFLSDPVLHC